jgi:hypothetical protein
MTKSPKTWCSLMWNLHKLPFNFTSHGPKNNVFFFGLTLAIFFMEAFNVIYWQITIQLICFSYCFMQCASKGGKRIKISLYKLCLRECKLTILMKMHCVLCFNNVWFIEQ